jgi:hypothetical protein
MHSDVIGIIISYSLELCITKAEKFGAKNLKGKKIHASAEKKGEKGPTIC